MNTPNWNLLPGELVVRRLNRIRRKRWVTLIAVYSAGLLLTCGVLWAIAHPGTASARSDAAMLAARNRETLGSVERTEKQLAVVREQLEHRKTLTEQPDFSIVLRLVSRSVEPETVLRQLSLSGSGTDTLRASPPAAGTEREPRHFLLTLTGTSRGEGSVSRLSDKLRASGAFDHVELKRTSRDPSGVSDAVAFEILCVISESVARASATHREGSSP
jgi:hypothetical protein